MTDQLKSGKEIGELLDQEWFEPGSSKRRREAATRGLGGRVTAFRTRSGLKIADLARAIGVSPSLISQIEHGRTQPSTATLFALAETLEVSIDAFFATHEVSEPGHSERRADAGHAAERYVVRRNERATVCLDGGARWERLTSHALANAEFTELVYGPGSRVDPSLYRHPGTAMILVLTGRLMVRTERQRIDLGPGDSICLPPFVPYGHGNTGVALTRAFSVIVFDTHTF